MGERSDLEFPSGEASCVAWVYQPGAARSRPGPCIVMGHGFSLTRHDGLPAYAEPLAAAGATVLVFGHRHLGDSPGEPRQRFQPLVGDASDRIAGDQIDFLRRLGLLGA